MTPSFYPQLVNGRFGDPGLYVDFKFEKRALLIDLGDLHALTPKKILRLTDIFISHAHLDHFIGFDLMLRVLLGREKQIRLYGPAGLIDRVEHKLAGYSWNLLDRYNTDLSFMVMELHRNRQVGVAAFHLRDKFRRSNEGRATLPSDVVRDDEMFQARAVVLDHGIPCLAFSIEERTHINIWKSGLDQLGLSVGPWLRDLKRAVMLNRPATMRIRIPPSGNRPLAKADYSLGELREKVVRVTRGQKIAYVTDARFVGRNTELIVNLAKDADTLFIEAMFSLDNSERAADRYHLTTGQAGYLARLARVREVQPFHFSPRYTGEEARLLHEVDEAFRGSD